MTSVNAAKYYCSISRAMYTQNLGHAIALTTLNIENEAYLSFKDNEQSKVPKINDRDNDRKILRWSHIFKDYLSNSCGSHGPLFCVLRDGPNMNDEVMDSLLDNYYCGESGNLISEF